MGQGSQVKGVVLFFHCSSRKLGPLGAPGLCFGVQGLGRLWEVGVTLNLLEKVLQLTALLLQESSGVASGGRRV